MLTPIAGGLECHGCGRWPPFTDSDSLDVRSRRVFEREGRLHGAVGESSGPLPHGGPSPRIER
jgi:hypothetical protein